MINKLSFNPVICDNPNPNREFPATMRAISFESNNCRLMGTMFLAEGEGIHPTLLLLHGFPGNETNFDIAHAVRRAGWNVLVFNYRGVAGSEGIFSWSNAIEDTKVAVEYLRSDLCKEEFNVDKSTIVIAGHSMGGFLSMLTLANDNNLKAAGYLGGFNYGLFGTFIEDKPDAQDLTLASLSYSTQFIKSISPQELIDEMIQNKNGWNLLNYLHQLAKKNVLLVAAKYDTISMNELHHFPLEKGFEQAGQNNHKSFILDSGHSFSDRRIELTQIVVDWILNLGKLNG